MTLPGGGATLLGNGGAVRDSANNVERVFAPDAFFGASPASTLGGPVSIVVRGRSLPLGGSQPFALTVYGAAAAARARSGLPPRLVPVSDGAVGGGECASAPRLRPAITRSPPPLGNVSTVSFAFEAPLLSSSPPAASTAAAGPLPAANAAKAAAADASSSPFECRLSVARTGATSPPPLFAWTRCSSPLEFRSLPDGGYTFSVRNSAVGGSTGSGGGGVTSASFAVDTAAPTAEIVGREAPMRSARRGAVFAFGAAAGEASAVSFECRLERALSAGGETTAAAAAATNETTPVAAAAPVILLGASALGAWEPCSSPVGYGGLGTGTWIFSVRARDAAGNEQRSSSDSSATSTSASWSVRLPRHAKLVKAERAVEGGGDGGGGGGGGGGGAAAPAPGPSPSPSPSPSASATARYSATFSFEADPGDEEAVARRRRRRVFAAAAAAAAAVSASSASSSTSASTSAPADAFECSLLAWNSSTVSFSTVASALQPCSSPKTYSDLPGGGTLYLFQVGVVADAGGSGGASASSPGDLAAATQLALGEAPAPADAAALLPQAKIDAFPPRVFSAAAARRAGAPAAFDVPLSLAGASPAADRFACSLQGPAGDGSLWLPCSSPHRLDFAAMVDGSYVLRVAAESDAAALAQRAAAEAAAEAGGATLAPEAAAAFNGRGAPASASFVLDSLAPNVTSMALHAQTTLRGGEVNSTQLEPVDVTFGVANEVSFFEGENVFLSGGGARFFGRKTREKKRKTLLDTKKKNSQTQADLALLRSLGVMPCAFAFRGSPSSAFRFAPTVAGADDGAVGSGVAGARCRLVPWGETAAPVLLVPIPVRREKGRVGGREAALVLLSPFF